MDQLNYEVLKKTGYDGYILEKAPEKVMQFGEGNFLRAFVDDFLDIANEKAGFNGKAVLVQPIAQGTKSWNWPAARIWKSLFPIPPKRELCMTQKARSTRLRRSASRPS